MCRDEKPEEMLNVNGVADVKKTRLSSAVFRYAVSKHGSWECMRICSPTVMSSRAIMFFKSLDDDEESDSDRQECMRCE